MAAPRQRSLGPDGLMLGMAADAAPGIVPGAAVRSIAAEDYRLARDRGASFGRRKEEARSEHVPSTLRRTPNWGIWGYIAGRPANVAQGVKFLSANAKCASGALVRRSGRRPPRLA
jgi:hypothetical protein